MYRRSRRMFIFPILAIMLTIWFTGCAAMPFGKPQGNNIGYCEGRLRLDSGRRTSFRIDLFASDGDGQLYLTIPGMYRYSPIEDFDFSDNHMEVELASGRTIGGEITGNSLTFAGNFNGLSGAITLDLDD